jgi:hypothetical protein
MYFAAFHHDDVTAFLYALWSVLGKVETPQGLPIAAGSRMSGPGYAAELSIFRV